MSTTDLPGSSLLAGRYRLVERLGAGGMSVVWRGFDEVLGRQVAVKVLPPSTSADPSFRRRLRAEAQAAARLSHPHITNVYDYGEATTADGEAVPYVVMELVDGESLAAVLARVRRLPWPAAVRICSEVSAALAAAHARGIVHRDVTPANVMLTASGAKVVDFGISALIGENDIDPDGSLLGTPAYLAPERLEGGQVSPATDVYAVGLLIYRTLIGQLPWDVGTTTALLRAHQYTEPEPMPPVEGLPPAVSALIGRCLEKRPDDRPSSAELAHVLAGVSAGAPASGGLVPDRGGSGEDTTILPSAYPYTGGLGRVRPGHARVGEPPAPGRGVAAVRAAADGPAGLAAAAAAMAAAAEGAGPDAPVSPAPGAAMPISVSDVEAALAGSRQAADGRPVAGSPAGPFPSGSAGVAAPESATPSGGNRGPGPAPGRNNRFGAVPRGNPVVGAPPAPAVPAAPAPAPIRPAFGGSGRPDGPDASARRADRGSPPPPAPDVKPAGGAPLEPVQRHGRRVLVVAAAVVAVGLATYGYSLAAGGAGSDEPDPLVLPSASTVAATGKCVVSYAVRTDKDKRFTASVTVANRDNVPVKDWKLWFIMQGDQVVSGQGKLKLHQSDTIVTVRAPAALEPQKALTMQVAGRYTLSNAAPMVFELNGKTCETYVSGRPGEASRPVQQVAGGGTRLGPPVADSPVPGVTVGPGGVVTPVPLPPTSGGPTGDPDPPTTPPPTGTVTSGPAPNPPTRDPSSSTPTEESDPPTTEPVTAPPVFEGLPDDEGDDEGDGGE